MVMKIFSTLLFVVCLHIGSLQAQDITGQWNGILKVQGTQLRLVFNVDKAESGFTATMDSPDQGAKGISVTHTTFENSKVKFEVANLRIEYNGELKGTEIIGFFSQAGQQFPMNLSKEVVEKEVVKMLQDPVKPYPYITEEVTFENVTAKISLAGTLSLPAKTGKFPVVILISGSGPQKRDEELLGHKPFLVIADYLTRNGFAVLRYDDRGVGKSTGNFAKATTADFATDVESAIVYLTGRKDIDTQKIGLIGHSEGGIIAPMVASKSNAVAFIVLLAGTGIPGDQLLLSQQKAIAKASGTTESEIQNNLEMNKKAFEMVVQSDNTEQLKTELAEYLNKVITETPNGMSKEQFVTMQVKQLSSPWMQYFLKYDPKIALEQVKCPVLAVNGTKDLQVPYKVNLSAIETALKKGENTHYTIKEFPNLNHLFQECETGLPSEYSQIKQTFSPIALDYITKWMQLEVKK